MAPKAAIIIRADSPFTPEEKAEQKAREFREFLLGAGLLFVYLALCFAGFYFYGLTGFFGVIILACSLVLIILLMS